MSQRVVLGGYSQQPIAVVREHGPRVEIIGLRPWVVPYTLEHIAGYWLGDFASHASPARSVLESFQ